MENRLQQAIRLARGGQKTEARAMLSELLRMDRSNELAWLWYAECVDSVAEQVTALEMCLRLNPGAQRARAGLLALSRELGKPTAAPVGDLGRTQPVFIGEREGKSAAKTAFVDGFGDPPTLIVPTTGGVKGDVAAAINGKVVEAAGAAGAATPAAGLPSRPAAIAADADGWVLSKGADVFTVPPDGISTDEFNRVEEATESFLLANPEIKPALRSALVPNKEVSPQISDLATTKPMRRSSLISRLLGLMTVTLITVLIMLIASLLVLSGA